jgi:probable addiction module antidote protein
MAKKTDSFKKGWVDRLKKDPELQIEYLKTSVEENSDMPRALFSALRTIAEARGFESLAEDANLSEKALYKILAENKDSKPRFETIVKLLDALGLRLSIESKKRVS